LCCFSIDKILFIECVSKKCKLCQNNPNANSIHIVMMPSTYCNNYHISIEFSTYSHQFDDLLMYVVPMLVIFFHWTNIDKMSNILVLYQCHFKTRCYNVTLTSYQWLYQHWKLNILLRCCKSTHTKRGQVCDVTPPMTLCKAWVIHLHVPQLYPYSCQVSHVMQEHESTCKWGETTMLDVHSIFSNNMICT